MCGESTINVHMSASFFTGVLATHFLVFDTSVYMYCQCTGTVFSFTLTSTDQITAFQLCSHSQV